MGARENVRRVPARAWLVAIATIAVMISVAATMLSTAAVAPLKGRPSSSSPAAAAATAVPQPGHEVYGFVPYWEMDDTIADHLRATATSTVALFSITQTSSGAIATNQSGYRRISGPIGRQIVADAHDLRRRVDVAWSSFGAAKNHALFASPAVQDRLIAALVNARAELGVDGLAVDVEGIDAADIPAFGAFVGRLRAAIRDAAPQTTVTVAAGAGPQGTALAVAANLAGADRIFLMGYDYRTAGSDPGGSAPLSRRDGVERSVGSSLELYAAAGIPAERTILGLPLYGLAWPTATADIGSPGTGPGEIWVPRQHLDDLHDRAGTASYDRVEDVAFLAIPIGKGFRSIYYDTPGSLRPKLASANDRGLAGAGFWALGYERGLAGYSDLIAAFGSGKAMMASGPSSPVFAGSGGADAAASPRP